MFRRLKRKDFRIVYLATILILGFALLAPPTAFAKYGGDPDDTLNGPNDGPPDGFVPGNGSNDAEARTGVGRLYLFGNNSVDIVVIVIEIPGSVALIPIVLSLPSWQDWGEQ